MTKAQKQESAFRCRGCNRYLPSSFGCGDDMPDHCDDCWAKSHTTQRERERT